MNPKIFPTIVYILQYAAAAVYLFQGNWKQALFWFGVGLANMVVVFL